MSDILYEGLTEEQKAGQRRGEEIAIGMLLNWYRHDAANKEFYHSHTNKYRNAERLEMISCICEFLADFMIYRFDSNTERLTLQNNGLPYPEYCHRWGFPISDVQYGIMKVRFYKSIDEFSKHVDKRKSQLSPDEEYGMRNVASQVLQLVDNYPSYSLLIENDSTGKGLGEKLYVALNRYRRTAAGHSIYKDSQPNEQSYPDIFF